MYQCASGRTIAVFPMKSPRAGRIAIRYVLLPDGGTKFHAWFCPFLSRQCRCMCMCVCVCVRFVPVISLYRICLVWVVVSRLFRCHPGSIGFARRGCDGLDASHPRQNQRQNGMVEQREEEENEIPEPIISSPERICPAHGAHMGYAFLFLCHRRYNGSTN